MSERPDYLVKGEPARLFPVLADTSKEGRTTAVFLSCLASVREFGASLLTSVGQSVGKTTRIGPFTEVEFKSLPGEHAPRPDGLLIARTGGREWRALIEAKVGAAELTAEQIESYPI